jgi:hypothetical protein
MRFFAGFCNDVFAARCVDASSKIVPVMHEPVDSGALLRIPVNVTGVRL